MMPMIFFAVVISMRLVGASHLRKRSAEIFVTKFLREFDRCDAASSATLMRRITMKFRKKSSPKRSQYI